MRRWSPISLVFIVALLIAYLAPAEAQSSPNDQPATIDPYALFTALANTPMSWVDAAWLDGAWVQDTSAYAPYPAIGQVTVDAGYPGEERAIIYEVYPSGADAQQAYDAWLLSVQNQGYGLTPVYGLGEAEVLATWQVTGSLPWETARVIAYYVVKVGNVLVIGHAGSYAVPDWYTVTGFAEALAREGIGHLERVTADLAFSAGA